MLKSKSWFEMLKSRSWHTFRGTKHDVLQVYHTSYTLLRLPIKVSYVADVIGRNYKSTLKHILI